MGDFLPEHGEPAFESGYSRRVTTRNPRVLVAMSGGVDSSVAAALLREQGYDIAGVTLRLTPEPVGKSVFEPCCSSEAVEDARRAAQQLGIPHHVLHVIDRFEREVIDDFVRQYLAGRTPNPCVRCNLAIKFGHLLEVAGELGADLVATGHYVRRVVREGRIALRKAVDPAKDQCYVLAGLSQTQLERALFPLGEFTKAETRERARTLNLPTANKPESQEICFVPDDDYRRFLAERVGPPTPGPIVSTRGEVLGEHHGLIRYTVGQRKGLGIAASRPYYVVRLDVAGNTVVVGHEEETYCSSLTAREINWCSVPPRTAPFACLAQIRYRHRPVSAIGVPAQDALRVEFKTAERAATPGQWVVLFDDAGYALAAGVIDTVSTLDTE